MSRLCRSYIVTIYTIIVFSIGYTNSMAMDKDEMQGFCKRQLSRQSYKPMSYKITRENNIAVLWAEGKIWAGEHKKLENMLQQATSQNRHIDEVWLNSPGGVGTEGLLIGGVLRKQGLATRIPDGAACFSACSYAFLGGVIRNIDPQGCYGVHMFTDFNEQTITDFVEETTKDRQATNPKTLLEKVQGWEQKAAELARMRAQYLTKMSVSLELMIPAFGTVAGSQNWLIQDELRRYNIVNTK